ncbi:hypothetical protein AB0L75_32385 [Streptomyces sp. NPDC052101]|uniref:hypothetical protein n=1 Tax=Streptomyces sp. NPDC052101 TaxID=3155763 RepID=UPI0034383AAA
MNAELTQLRKLREEEAVVWQRETEVAERRVRDLYALVERARAQMPLMSDEGRADVIDLIDVEVTRVVEVLAGFRTIPVVPVPEASKEPPLPDMLVEGVVEPHLFPTDDDEDGDGETRVGTVASSTTMSWQAAMTVSAMPGCPSRRATPGFGF